MKQVNDHCFCIKTTPNKIVHYIQHFQLSSGLYRNYSIYYTISFRLFDGVIHNQQKCFFFFLKPKYSFGKWWKWKISLMGIVHKSCMSSQRGCESFCSKPSMFVENCTKLTLSGCPREFSHRDMYIAPSSGHTSFNFNMPFKLILRRCEVVF